MADPVEVLDFWIGEVGEDGWYAGGEEIDTLCRDRFAEEVEAARSGGFEHWVDGTVGTLAYLILTDQLPRNIHRDTPLAFASDARALAAAKRAVAAGWDMGAPEPEREFFYLPFEHSEDMADQETAVELIGTRLPETGADTLLHARAHREVIRRFGRFPTRNASLGRANTPEEAEYLAQGGYRALVERLKSEAMQ
jgi:uncharacterized protein (DUF924 family)